MFRAISSLRLDVQTPSVPILCPTSVPTICQTGRNDFSIDDFWADSIPDFGHGLCAHFVPTSSTLGIGRDSVDTHDVAQHAVG